MELLPRAVAFAVCMTLSLGASQPGRVTESEARQWATEAAEIAKGNVKTFNREFQKRANGRIQDYEPSGFEPFVFSGPNRGLLVTLYGPVAAFQTSAAEMVRQIRPLANAVWFGEVVLTISTTSMTAPRIGRAVVKRGDEVIEPSRNAIRETQARNLEGAVFDAREGNVFFALAAFEPKKGAQIRLILIPETGKNLETTLRSYSLPRVRELPK